MLKVAPSGFQHLVQPQTWLCAVFEPGPTSTLSVAQWQCSVPPAKSGLPGFTPPSTAGSDGRRPSDFPPGFLPCRTSSDRVRRSHHIAFGGFRERRGVCGRSDQRRNARSRLRAVSRAAGSGPRRSISRAETTSVPSKIAPVTSAPVRSAPPSGASVRSAPTKRAPRSEPNSRSAPHEPRAGEIGAVGLGVLEHAAGQAHRLVAHVGAKSAPTKPRAGQVGAGEVGDRARAGKIGGAQRGAARAAPGRGRAPTRLALVRSAPSSHAWPRSRRRAGRRRGRAVQAGGAQVGARRSRGRRDRGC